MPIGGDFAFYPRSRGSVVAAPAVVPSQLAITVQPGGASSGIALTQQPSGQVLTAAGSLVNNSTLAVTAAIASGTGVLSGTLTVSSVNGVWAFANLVVTGTDAAGYTLVFTATGLTSATSSNFSTSAAPQFVLGVSTLIFVGDSSSPLIADGDEALSAGQITYRCGTVVSVGKRVINGGNRSQLTDLKIESDGGVTSATANFTAAWLNYGLYIRSGTSFNTGQWYVSYVDVSTHRAYLSQTQITRSAVPGPVGVVGSLTGTADGVACYANLLAAPLCVYECTTGGTTGDGTTAPIGETVNTIYTDNGVGWKCLGYWVSGFAAFQPEHPLSALQLVTGIHGTGKAARIPWVSTVNAFTDGQIDASDNTLFTCSAIPTINGSSLNAVNISGGTGFTVQQAVIQSVDHNGWAKMNKAMGTIGSTGGTGEAHYTQYGQQWGVKWLGSSPAEGVTVCGSMDQLFTGTVADYFAPGFQIKFLHQIMTSSVMQCSTIQTSVITAGGGGYSTTVNAAHGNSCWATAPGGYFDAGPQACSISSLTIDSADNTIFYATDYHDVTGGSVYAGCNFTIGAHAGFSITPGVYTLMYAEPYGLRTGGGNATRWRLCAVGDASLTPLVIGTTSSAGATATTSNSGINGDAGAQPVAPFPLDIWNTITNIRFRFRPHSSPTQFDGTFQLWVGGTLVVWVAHSVVGSTPSGGLKPWCNLATMLNLPIVGSGGTLLGDPTMYCGDLMTAPSPVLSTVTQDVNIGDGDATHTGTAILWAEPGTIGA